MKDITALLVVEFEDSVDPISRAMFSERMEENGWRPCGVRNTWTLEFEPRSKATMRDTTRNHLELASRFARFELSQLRAVAQYGDEEPIQFSRHE